MDETLINTLRSYFKAEKIKVAADELKLQLFSHPHTPSLYAISETLNFLNIENVAAQIDKDQLEQLPSHFIAFVKNEKGQPRFSHVEQQEDSIYLHDKKESMSKTSFKELWDGIILLAEQENSATTKLVSWNLLALGGLFVLMTLVLWFKTYEITFVILGLTGLVVSREIFKTTHGKNSFLGEKLCSQHNQKDQGCAKVLKSSSFTLGLFSFNDGLFAFLASTMVFTLIANGFTLTHLLGYGIAILVVFATIFIQGFILKAWCKLCLLSSGILILQAIVLFSSWSGYENLFTSLLSLNLLVNMGIWGLLFLVSLIGIHQLRSLQILHFETTASKIELLRFKRSPEIIQSVLKNATLLSHPNGSEDLQFGNLKANTTLRLILSTSCGFCKLAFEQFHAFYTKNSDVYKFQIIFNHYEDGASPRNDVAVRCINSLWNHGEKAFFNTLADWYHIENIESFSKKHPLHATEMGYEVLQRQRDWCKENALYHTPILVLNRKIIPPQYDATFIEDFIEVLDEESVLEVEQN